MIAREARHAARLRAFVRNIAASPAPERPRRSPRQIAHRNGVRKLLAPARWSPIKFSWSRRLAAAAPSAAPVRYGAARRAPKPPRHAARAFARPPAATAKNRRSTAVSAILAHRRHHRVEQTRLVAGKRLAATLLGLARRIVQRHQTARRAAGKQKMLGVGERPAAVKTRQRLAQFLQRFHRRRDAFGGANRLLGKDRRGGAGFFRARFGLGRRRRLDALGRFRRDARAVGEAVARRFLNRAIDAAGAIIFEQRI